jgi:hypothetical protein
LGGEEVGIDWNTVTALLEELEVVAEVTLVELGDVSVDEEYGVEVWVVLVADVPPTVVLALGAMGDDVDVLCRGENEA